MRIARAEGVLRDGAIDTLVVAHEWGHYISYRLIGDSNGLDTNQAGGLGEGWSDFHQMLLLVKDADRNLPNNANFGGTYASNTYLLGGPDFAPDVVNNAYYYGDRRYPYTRDLAKNPLTLRHISDERAAAGRADAVAALRGPRQLGSAQRRRGLGLAAVGVLQQPAERHGAAHVRAGAGPDEALPRRGLQGHADQSDVRDGARRAARRHEVAGQRRLRTVPARLREARRGPGRRGAGRVLADEQRRRRELQDGEARGRHASAPPSSTTTRASTTTS